MVVRAWNLVDFKDLCSWEILWLLIVLYLFSLNYEKL